MDTIFNGYLTEEARESALFEAKFNVEFSRLETMLEMLDLHYEQQIREAEYKVFSEGGTYDDYQYLLEEAQKEAAAQEKGVIGKLIDSIIGLFQSIINGITSVFTKNKVDPKATYNVAPEKQAEFSQHQSWFDKIKTSVGNVISYAQAGQYDKALEAAKPISAVIAGAGAAAGATVATVKAVQGSQVLDQVKSIDGLGNKIKVVLNELKKAAASMKDKAPKSLNDLIKVFKDIGNAIKAKGQDLIDIVIGVGKTIIGQDAGAPQDDTQGQPQPAANPQPAPAPAANPAPQPAPAPAPAAGTSGIANASVGEDDLTDIQRSIFGEMVNDIAGLDENAAEINAVNEAFDVFM